GIYLTRSQNCEANSHPYRRWRPRSYETSVEVNRIRLYMHVIVSGIGSAGDVNPFIEIARELVSRGHSVDFITSPYFEDKLKLSNLNLLRFGTRQQFLQTAADPEMWHPRRGFAATWRALRESLGVHYSLIAE